MKEKTSFPTKILKCLIQQFSVFPLGTHVRLNTGESAEVVELNPQYPLRPVVKVLKDTHGSSLKEARTLDLSKSSLVHVSEVAQDDQLEWRWQGASEYSLPAPEQSVCS